ncbi:MAG: hypothetical protein J6Y47_08125 [Bacteroidales bacterium]|nr:hypothetical protein [Bacteroidales bacterium]
MKKKYNNDLGLYFIYGLFAPISFVVFGVIAKMTFSIYIIFTLIIYVYIASTTICFFSFYDTFYEVYFPTRFFNRRIKILYSDIEYAEYDTIHIKGQKMIRLGKYGRKRNSWFYSLRYEVACDSEVAKPLLLFLKNKGLKIKIVSYKNNEYADILEDL